jgi:hypothetical protein
VQSKELSRKAKTSAAGAAKAMDRISVKSCRWIYGLAIWLLAGGLLVWRAEQSAGNSLQNQVIPQLWQYATGRVTPVQFKMEQPAYLAVGDPIFVIRGETIEQVGQVAKVLAGSGRAKRATMALSGTASFYTSTPGIGPGAQLRYHSSSDSLQWVLQTMLPPEKRAWIARDLGAAFEEHQAEILSALRPVIEASLPEVMRVLEEDLKSALAARRGELAELGGKYQHEIIERQLAPLMSQEIWPIVMGHFEPMANEIGKEIWERASLWRFGWRSAYDKLLLNENPLMRKEWARFVKEDAVPVLEQRAGEFVQLQQRILMDIARNEQVRAAIREGVQQMADDPELRQLVGEIFRDVIVQNPRLRQVLAKHWTGPEAQRAFQAASDRLEPAIGRAGELLFGSPDRGITPEFSRVLRSRVLGKDRRWLVFEQASNRLEHRTDRSPNKQDKLVLNVRPGGAAELNPFDAGLAGTNHALRP